MNCPNCGAAVQEGTKFCMKCGKPINVQEAAQQAFRQAAPAAPIQPQYQQTQYQQPQYQQTAYRQAPVQPQYQQPYGQPRFGQPAYGQTSIPTGQFKKDPAALRLIGVAAAVITGVSTVLPYMKILGEGYGLFSKYMGQYPFKSDIVSSVLDGYFLLGIAVIGLLFALANVGIGQIIMGGAGIAFWIIEWNKTGGKAFGLVPKGIAYYTMLIGSILLIIAGIITMIVKHNVKRQSSPRVNWY